jgi:methyl coenzyme M reductase beta subunit
LVMRTPFAPVRSSGHVVGVVQPLGVGAGAEEEGMVEEAVEETVVDETVEEMVDEDTVDDTVEDVVEEIVEETVEDAVDDEGTEVVVVAQSSGTTDESA